MDIILDSITQWLREILVGGIMDNLTGLFDQVNTKVGEIAGQVGQTPQAWNSSVYPHPVRQCDRAHRRNRPGLCHDGGVHSAHHRPEQYARF